jgi:4'-phosphopantetheinyl transferase
VLDLAEFAFAPEELGQLAGLERCLRTEHFYVLWTLKEAFAKALGIDLPTALRACVFLRNRTCWSAQVPTRDAWRCEVRRVFTDFIAAAVLVAAHKNSLTSLGSPRSWPVVAAAPATLIAEITS